MGVHLAETLVSLDVRLGLSVRAGQLGDIGVALLVGEGVSHLLAPRDLEQRRLSDIDVPAVNEWAHEPEEECKEQRPYVAAVHIGIRHYDYLAVAELGDVKILAYRGAERGHDGGKLLVAVNLVYPRLFDVEHFAPEGEYRLILSLPALLG